MEDRRQLGVLIEARYSNGIAPLKQYLFTDALGSVDVIASATGAVLQRMSFDPHGGRRNANDWNSAAAFVIPPYTTRGFTGHEQLDSVGLVHMGARVYDPELGRFLQPDPMLDAGLQGLNRYSYVLNNPLALTDPSGYLSLGQLLRTVVAVAITVYTGGAGPAAFGERRSAPAKPLRSRWPADSRPVRCRAAA
ncbi:MAG: RHS repeat-associated core domain-containing protein [Aquimonas sp.]|nr:RHS repeat-associated core domain-containing protein [Aquimonas sp.]